MDNGLKKYELWWTNNLGNETYVHNGQTYNAPSVSKFKSWMGDSFSKDRICVRKKFGEFKTFLDAGCGACPEYKGLNDMYKDINYTGMDITPKLVEYNISQNINCVQGSLNNIPFKDNSFDIVHSRHVVEHMNNIENPISEMIRVASKKVFNVFFIKPTNKSHHIINLDNKETIGEVYHNKYSKQLIEEQLNENKKVKDFEWIKIPAPSCELLLINLI